MEDQIKEHIEFIMASVQNNIEKAKKSGALSGEENDLAIIRAVTRITVESLPLTSEAKELYNNLVKII